jgi:hypothetical protein
VRINEAYAASEDLRASILLATEWEPLQTQLIRVIPVVQRVLRTLAELKKVQSSSGL